jgi:hypothetical protein
MIIHLFFDKYLPMNEEELNDYGRCMPLETPPTRTYTEADCSKNGYLKIMLFYYFFHLAKKMDIPSIKGNLIQQLLNMPPIEEVDVHLFDGLPRITEPVFGYQIQLDNPSLLPDILNKVIKPILRSGFYFELGLEEILYESEESIPPAQHIVLIVGAESGNVGIKNSWGDSLNVVLFDEVIELGDESFKLIDLFFVIPNDYGKYAFHPGNMDELYRLLETTPPRPLTGGKKRKTKYGQRRNHYQSKAIRASRKRSKTYHKRRLSKH